MLIFKNKKFSVPTNNVISGNHGKICGTNAMEAADLLKIKVSLLELGGIEDALLDTKIFSRELTVHTNKMVPIADIENRVKAIGFHVIAKDLFEL